MASRAKPDADWKQVHRCVDHLLFMLTLLKLVEKKTAANASMDIRNLSKYIELKW